jgi:FkbM family methyltransferase
VRAKSHGESEATLSYSDVIFDFGANHGEDIDYYLSRASKVIAVEADPNLAVIIRDRFEKEIIQGRLVLVNKVITTSDSEVVTFYLHKTNPGLNQFERPSEEKLSNFNLVDLEAVNIIELVKQFADRESPPKYCKIDLEGFDFFVLNALFENEIFPVYLSAECHSLDIVKLIISTNRYEAFNLIEGQNVPKLQWAKNPNSITESLIQFEAFSAGPFGNDIKKNWLTERSIVVQMRLVGPGWKDLHAVRSKNVLSHEVSDRVPFRIIFEANTRRTYRLMLPYNLRTVIWKLRRGTSFSIFSLRDRKK